MSCFIIVVVVWVFSVCLHEYGHAKVAQLGGDYTVEEKGYLSMNPMHYADPIMSFVLPILFMILGGIGLPGGAVYINRSLIRTRNWETAMSLAGPAMNLIIAIILALVLRLYLVPHYYGHVATYALAFALQLQISAVLFNLIPIPPLDGFGAILPWLTEDWRERVMPVARYGMLILFLVFWEVRPVNIFFWDVVNTITSMMGVDPDLGFQGYSAFQFWRQ